MRCTRRGISTQEKRVRSKPGAHWLTGRRTDVCFLWQLRWSFWETAVRPHLHNVAAALKSSFCFKQAEREMGRSWSSLFSRHALLCVEPVFAHLYQPVDVHDGVCGWAQNDGRRSATIIKPDFPLLNLADFSPTCHLFVKVKYFSAAAIFILSLWISPGGSKHWPFY